MVAIFVEDKNIDILEEVIVESKNFSIDNESLHTNEKLSKLITTDIYAYPDGICIYLEIDDANTNKFIKILFGKMENEVHRELFTSPFDSTIYIKRITKDILHIIIKENLARHGNIIFAEIGETDVSIVNVDYTELVIFEKMSTESYILGTTEVIGSEVIWDISARNFNGKIQKVFLDEKTDDLAKFEVLLEDETDSSKKVIINSVKSDGSTQLFSVFKKKED